MTDVVTIPSRRRRLGSSTLSPSSRHPCLLRGVGSSRTSRRSRACSGRKPSPSAALPQPGSVSSFVVKDLVVGGIVRMRGEKLLQMNDVLARGHRICQVLELQLIARQIVKLGRIVLPVADELE